MRRRYKGVDSRGVYGANCAVRCYMCAHGYPRAGSQESTSIWGCKPIPAGPEDLPAHNYSEPLRRSYSYPEGIDKDLKWVDAGLIGSR